MKQQSPTAFFVAIASGTTQPIVAYMKKMPAARGIIAALRPAREMWTVMTARSPAQNQLRYICVFVNMFCIIDKIDHFV
jgi:hypothetical protein